MKARLGGAARRRVLKDARAPCASARVAAGAERPLQRPTLNDHQRDSARQAAREMRRPSRGEVDLEVPELQPIFDQLLVDDRDYLWVMLTPEPDCEDGTKLDVFDPDGVYLGAVETPYRAE